MPEDAKFEGIWWFFKEEDGFLKYIGQENQSFLGLMSNGEV